MEVLEAKPASGRARLWARLLDPDKPPRRWWFPPSSRRDDVLRMSEEARQDYQQVAQQAHEKFSETIRLAMLSLLGFALFCVLITFSAPDSSLLVADPTIKMPFADVQVSFQSFLILAPFLLIVITLYLHIFYGYWLDLETDLRHLTPRRESSEPSIERLPTLFSLDHSVPRLLTAFIFYWLVPLALIAITWKAAARLEWGIPLVLFTALVTVTLVFLQIRRCPASQRKWNRPRWGVMGLIIGCIAALTFELVAHLPSVLTRSPRIITDRIEILAADRPEWEIFPGWLPRPLNLVRADLKGKGLAEVNIRFANAIFTNLQDADLRGANLGGADLQGANLQGANLRNANLQNDNLRTDLFGANLRSAVLQRANLQGAELWYVDFQDADLQGANLRDAGLNKAVLQRANLQGANLQETNLQGADLQGTNLQGADLQGANLQEVDLRGANLQHADLRRATLAIIDLRDANLWGADLQGATLGVADLRGADLRWVKGLTEEQLQFARTDENTKFSTYPQIPKPAEPDHTASPQGGAAQNE